MTKRRGRCVYCGANGDLTKDHIIPRSVLPTPLGPRNVAHSCGSCNALKADLSPGDMRLLANDMRSVAGRLNRIARGVDRLCRERGLQDPLQGR